MPDPTDECPNGHWCDYNYPQEDRHTGSGRTTTRHLPNKIWPTADYLILNRLALCLETPSPCITVKKHHNKIYKLSFDQTKMAEDRIVPDPPAYDRR